MSVTKRSISGIVKGNNYVVNEICVIPDSILELDETIVKAWLTVKMTPSDVDNSVFQKIISTAEDVTKGVILSTSNFYVIQFKFYLLPTDTVLLLPSVIYNYDIQCKTSDGRIYTPIIGYITSLQNITISNT